MDTAIVDSESHPVYPVHPCEVLGPGIIGDVSIDIKTSNALCIDVMRTTLTLNDDVALQLEQVRKERNMSLKKAVNEALRQGLQQMSGKPRRRKRFHTKTVSLGSCLVGSLDDVAEVLAVVDGDTLK